MPARLTVINNPLIPDKNRYVGYFPYKTIGEARAWLDGQEVNITVDSWMVPDSYEPKTSEMVIITPVVGKGGKNILGIIAVLTVAVVSMGVGSVAADHAFFAFSMKGATAWAFAAAAATMFIGGTLVSHMMTQNSAIDSGAYDYDTNPTYSWGDPTTMEGQNNAIATTYGKVLSAGQTLGKFVSLDGDNEVLNWLVGCGEGELEITDIKLNDNPISYYSDITCEIRSGTNNQAIISNFNDTYFTESVAAILSGTTPVIRQAQGTATEGLIFKIGCENGLYYASDDGSLSNAWVKLKLEYKLTSAANYTEWQTVTITGSQNNALRKEYRLDHLPAGAYDVRVTCIERSHSETSNRACVKVWLNTITSIVYDDFTYPNIALIGIKGLATDQLNGSPTLKFIKERRYIWAYNPSVGGYEQKPANNPAWACYDMLHQARLYKNINTGNDEFMARGVDKNHILYDQFNEWAAWCQSMELFVNIELVESGEMLNMINTKIACIGRGLVIRFGTKYGCKWGHVQNPIQMFGMGNIVKDSFEERFLSVDDRANAVEITFVDADREYQRRTITVFGNTYNTDACEKATQLTYDGITNYRQAYREGKYQMACNQYLLRTVAFDAEVDSIACTVGDVIIVAHDIVKAAYSGRISAVNGNSVTLPTVDTVDTTQRYRLMFRSSEHDTLEEVNINLAYNSSNELVATMTDTPEHAPAVNDIYDLALVSTGRRMYTVQSISRTSDFRRHIEALEYNAHVYAEDYNIPQIDYTRPGDVAQNVTGLSCAQVGYVKKDGTRSSQLSCSWNAATSGGHYNVDISTNGVDWTRIKSNTSQLQCKADVQPWTTYYVRVITILGVTQSSGTIAYPVPPGDDVLPPNVTELNAEYLRDGTRRYYWKFSYPDPNDIAGFKMRYLPGVGGTWEQGIDVQAGLITAQPYEATTIRQGVHTVMIKAVDNSGQESPVAASVIVNFGDQLKDNVLQETSFNENGWAVLWAQQGFWPSDMNTDFWPTDMTNPFWDIPYACGVYIDSNNYIRSMSGSYMWQSPTAPAWEYQTNTDFWPVDINTDFWPNNLNVGFWDNHLVDSDFWTPNYSDVYVQMSITAVAGGYWWLETDVEGPVKIYYWINSDTIKKQYSTKVKVAAGDVIHISLESEPANIIIRNIVSIIDVPDREEHFDSLNISSSGTTLPIITPNYKTVAVRIDSINVQSSVPVFPLIVSREPCIIQIVKADGTPVAATAQRITWQGYECEV